MQVTNGLTILVGEENAELRGYFQMAIKCLGHSVVTAHDHGDVISCLQSGRSDFAAVVLDIGTPDGDDFEVLADVRRIDPDLPVIVVSGVDTPLNVVRAMKGGATDYLIKPVSHEDLRKAISRTLDARGVRSSPVPRSPSSRQGAFVGASLRMREIHALVGRIGASDAPVLIQGETGSGKEVLAREVHAHSPRARKIFLKLNCAALPSELVESELFGYERGAFTGAFQRKAGMFEAADGGSIFLDEIGDMDVRLQAKLLQVLQDHEFQRIGGKETIKVDVRVIAATHRDLEKAIAEGSFREDLYYRLNVINVVLPPLRERPEDIVPMAEFLMRKHAEADVLAPPVNTELEHAMTTYHWPGNVRELENFVRKYLIFRDPDMLARDLRARAARRPMLSGALIPAASPDAPQPAGAPILEQVSRAKNRAEADVILAALQATRWNRKRVAELLKIDYKALLYKMKKLNLEEKPAPLAEVPMTLAVGG